MPTMAATTSWSVGLAGATSTIVIEVGVGDSVPSGDVIARVLGGSIPPDDIRRAFAIARSYRSTLTRHDRYRILYSYTGWGELQQKVNSARLEGWEPQGGVSVSMDHPHEIWAQAMSKPQ